MLSISDLPLINALLNTCSTLFLLAGFRFIKKKNTRLHRTCMVSALVTSSLFLSSYLVYHYSVGSVGFTGQGWVRPVYFTVLISHTVLAATVPPLAIITLIRALREQFDRHRRLARWTLPVWLYVSATGVIIYFMLYRMFPPS